MSEKEAAVSIVSKDDYSIDDSISRWRLGLIMLGGQVFFGYVIYFFFIPGQVPEKYSATLGQFGDFVGGLLNPLMAFAAFYWLTQSVKLQKQELADTRKALEDSAAAQVEQAESSRRSVRIGALSALLNAIQSELATQQSLLSKYLINEPEGATAQTFYYHSHGNSINEARNKIDLLTEKKSELEIQLWGILSASK